MNISEIFVWGAPHAVYVVKDNMLEIVAENGIRTYVRVSVATWGKRILGISDSTEPETFRRYRAFGGPGSFYTIGGWDWIVKDEKMADSIWKKLMDMVGPSLSMI